MIKIEDWDYPKYLDWVKNLNIGDKLIVLDNSFVFEVIPSQNFKRKKSALHPEACIKEEIGSDLIIMDIYKKDTQNKFLNALNHYPRVLLRSIQTEKIYEVGICWEECK